MNRKLTLLLPLALMAACSQTPAPAGTGGDDVAPAAAKAADQQTLAHLDAQRLQSQHWLLQQATGADGKRIDALFARRTSRSPSTSLTAACRSATPATAWAVVTPSTLASWPSARWPRP